MTTATVTQAYRYALDPTPAQQRALASQVGAASVAFNRMLGEVKATLDVREWEQRLLGGCVTEPAGVVVAGVAAHVEPTQRRVGAVVVGVLEGGVQHRAGLAVVGAGELGEIEGRHSGGGRRGSQRGWDGAPQAGSRAGRSGVHRALGDAALAEIRRQLAHKTEPRSAGGDEASTPHDSFAADKTGTAPSQEEAA